MVVAMPKRATKIAGPWERRRRTVVREDSVTRSRREKPERKKPMAVAGFIVTKRGERASSQGMPTAQPVSTAAEIDIAATAATQAKVRNRR